MRRESADHTVRSRRWKATVPAIKTASAYAARIEDPADVHNKVLVETLQTLLQVCHFGGRAQLWDPFHVALSRLMPRPPERLVLAASTVSDPVRRALPVLGRLDAAIAEQDRETSPARIVRTGVAALYVDRLPHYRDPPWRGVQHGREGGAGRPAMFARPLPAASRRSSIRRRAGSPTAGQRDDLDALLATRASAGRVLATAFGVLAPLLASVVSALLSASQ